MAIRLQDWLSRATQALAPVAEQPRSEARRLVEAALDWPVASQLADPDRIIDAASVEALDALLHRRAERQEPLSRILGRREFWGLSLEIDGATLDPRPDTETLVELALDLFSGPERSPPGQILDLGTGAGALLLALLSEYPEAQGLGVDQDSDTLATATLNAARLGLGGRARFEVGDWLSEVSGRFDLIVSNPPFHEGRSTSYQPSRALIERAPKLLRRGGELYLVANRFLPYHEPLQQAFGSEKISILWDGPRFRVYHGTRRSPRSIERRA